MRRQGLCCVLLVGGEERRLSRVETYEENGKFVRIVGYENGKKKEIIAPKELIKSKTEVK